MTDAPMEKKKNRSPEHPSMGLSEAIARAELLYEAEGFHWMNAEVAAGHLGYTPKSSPGLRALAALKHFSLLEDAGSGKDRKVKLSDLARRIIRDKREGSTERVEAIREAALAPSIYYKLWERWGAEGRLPSESTMEHQLEHEWEFNPNSIPDFLSAFVATIEFAGLLGKTPSSADPEQVSGPQSRPAAPGVFQSPDIVKASSLPAASPNYLDLPLPLISGGRALLRIPVPLTAEDFELLNETIATSLRVMRRALVAPDVSASDAAS